jgi:hypothetical protein
MHLSCLLDVCFEKAAVYCGIRRVGKVEFLAVLDQLVHAESIVLKLVHFRSQE